MRLSRQARLKRAKLGRLKCLIIILSLASIWFPVRAQTNELSLSAACALARQHNWDLLAAHSGVDAATAALLITREFPNPNLSAGSTKIGERENATPAGNGLWARSYDTVFAVNQLIEIGGKRASRQAAARAGVTGARARFRDAVRGLDQGVTKAYVAAALATENARILRASADFMGQEVVIAQARYQAGDLAEADLQQLQVSAGQYTLQAQAAETAALQARIAVDILLGREQPRGAWTPGDNLADLATAPVAAETSHQRCPARCAGGSGRP